MAFYRKKPVVIEAVCLDDVIIGADRNYRVVFDTKEDLPEWLTAALINEVVYPVSDEPPQVIVKTFEGEMFASKGDWIIRGVKGELYPCKPDVFRVTYDPAAEPERDISGTAI